MRHELKRIGIDTGTESVAFLSSDSLVCRCLGLHPLDRVAIEADGRTVLSVLDGVTGDAVTVGAVGLSDYAFDRLALAEGTDVDVRPAEPPVSVDAVRAKVAGHRLTPPELDQIARDIVAGRYSKIELTAFVVASAIHGLDDDEVVALVEAMVASGERLRWDAPVVADKHSIGGVPGNRTTPIVVAIAAAAGLTIPKASSRSVTSPAGTADTLETVMDVELTAERIRAVVEERGGCMVWGGAFNLAPADDLIIRVEHPLNIDCEGLMIASILAKKLAAGSTHVVLDIPAGPGAKVRSADHGAHLGARFERLAARLGLRLKTLVTDGSQPIGRGVGPVLEMRDVLGILRGEAVAPVDLRDKALALAGELLELTGAASTGTGAAKAAAIVDSGAALAKFEGIRSAQGARELGHPGRQTHDLPAATAGRVSAIRNDVVARVARLAGAPRDSGAGIDLLVHAGDVVAAGQPLLRVHAESAQLLEFALAYLAEHPDVVAVEP